MGAALADHTIFSLAPLLVISISIAGIVFGDEAVQGEIVNQIQGLMGPDAAHAVQTMIQSAHKPANRAMASIMGLVVLFLGALGVFNDMQDALNEICGVDTTFKTGFWNLIKTRFLSFGMVLGIGFLLLVSLLLSAFLAAVAILKLLPDVKISWSDVWVGVAMSAILFTMGKFLIGFSIGKSVTASAYGAAGSLVVIVAWIYYCASSSISARSLRRCTPLSAARSMPFLQKPLAPIAEFRRKPTANPAFLSARVSHPVAIAVFP